MHKAFLFDLDGVIIDSEPSWENNKETIFGNLFGGKITSQLGSTLGVDIETIYKKAKSLGATISQEEFKQKIFETAIEIYKTAPLTTGLDRLAKYLEKEGFRIGLVSASPKRWIDETLKRLSFKDKIEVIISLYEIKHIPHKPAPDGYQEAMRKLNSSPSTTVILEDSNAGIESALASGAYTIALGTNLVEGYKQAKAHNRAKDINDVIKIIQKIGLVADQK